jgi:hypothetical protein
VVALVCREYCKEGKSINWILYQFLAAEEKFGEKMSRYYEEPYNSL